MPFELKGCLQSCCSEVGGGAVGVTVGVAVGGAVGVAVGGAVRVAVGDAVRVAVGGAVGSAVGGAAGCKVIDAVVGAVQYTIFILTFLH